LDRVQHMCWKHDPETIARWYQELDALFGRIEDKLKADKKQDTQLLVVSDHGFKDFNYKVDLNRWLIDKGFLTPKETKESGNLKEVDWSKSQAYAIGLNSLYLNLEGREGQGTIEPAKKNEITEKIRTKMRQWKGPDGNKVVKNVYTQEEAYEGPYTPYGPDLIVGYAEGYRASAETGLGEWKKETIEPNQDHWGGDHCMDPAVVPGVLFSNKGLKDFPNPSYADFPQLAIGKKLTIKDTAPPPTYSDEDQEVLEERLKDLGYL